MARYLVEKATRLQPLQAGDHPQPLAFIVPDSLDMTSRGAIFVMEDKADTVVISKNSTGDYLEVIGQLITIVFTENDTKDLDGVYDWTLRVTGDDELITVGYGKIQVNQIG